MDVSYESYEGMSMGNHEMNYDDGQPKYEMRAPPRRRKDNDEQPLFLRKAFTMVTNCSPEMGGWTERGDTFIIKDPKEFAEKLIPVYYKHNNFSSFVRQLNFYGFRKVKSENLLNPSWWEFRHPQFIRGQPRLLSEIKRAVHYGDASSTQDVAELRSQVSTLKDRLSEMNDSICELTSLVSNMILSDSSKLPMVQESKQSDKNKKRRTRGNNGSNVNGIMIPNVASIPVFDDEEIFDTLSSSSTATTTTMIHHGTRNQLPTGPELASSVLFRSSSNEVAAANDALLWDDETLENLMSMENNDVSTTTMTTSTSVTAAMAPTATLVTSQQSLQSLLQPTNHSGEVFVSTAEPLSGQIVQDLSQLISSLSPDMQARFVDKLAESIGAHLSSLLSSSLATTITASPVQMSRSKYEDVKESSSSSSQGYNATTSGNMNSETPAIALPLASAALGALLARYSTMSSSQPAMNPPHINTSAVSRELIQASS